MKINRKFTLITIIANIILILFFAFFFMWFNDYMSSENLKIEVASLRILSNQLHFSMIEMRTSAAPSSFLIRKYQQNLKEIQEKVREIEKTRIFKILPQDIQILFNLALKNWMHLNEKINTSEMQSSLDLRLQVSPNAPASVSALLANLRNKEEIAFPLVTELEIADLTFSNHEQLIADYQFQQRQALLKMQLAIDQVIKKRFFLGVLLPSIILLISLLSVFMSVNSLKQNLDYFNKAIINVAGGDFTTQFTIKGNDEFKEMVSSVNTLTQTLGHKLELFRLLMHDTGQMLESSFDASQMEESILLLAIKNTIADGAAIYEIGEDRNTLVLSCKTGQYRLPFNIPDMPESPDAEDLDAMICSYILNLGETIIGESAMRGKSQLIRDVVNDPNVDWNRDESDPFFLSSVIAVPLKITSAVFGVLVTTVAKPNHFFSNLDFINMQSFGELAAISLDNLHKYSDLLESSQLNQELNVTEEIQKELLPKAIPYLPGHEVSYLIRNLKGLNNEYFDVHRLSEDLTMLVIFEVAGRGVPTALVMVMIQTILRLVASPDTDAQNIMNLLNQYMTQRITIENYAGGAILVVSSDGNFSFAATDAYPLEILRKNGELHESVKATGIPIGIDKKVVYEQKTGQFHPGDVALFYTDGITESQNRDGQVFGVTNLIETIQPHSTKHPEDMCNILRNKLQYFERDIGQKDNQTAVILKYRGNKRV